MASTNLYGNSTTNSNYRGKLILSSTKDEANNRSTVTWSFKVFRSDGYNSSYDRSTSNHFTLTVDGSQVYSNTSFRAWMGSNGTSESTANTWVSGSFTVNHNSDGNKTISISAKYWNTASDSIGSSSKPLTVSGSFALDSIPRASSISVADMTMGVASTITINKASSGFTHTLTYSYNGATGTIATKTSASSVSWTPATASLAPYCTNAKYKSCTITCTTYSGNTAVGTSTATINLYVPNLPPSFNVTGELVDGINGKWVQNISRCTLTFSSESGQYGATIASRTINSLQNAPNPYTSVPIAESGTKTFTCTVTDSRGYSTTKTVTISNIYEYNSPVLSDVNAYRCDSNGDRSTSGTYVYAIATASVTSLDGDNTGTLTVYGKLHSDPDSSYTSLGTLTSGTASVINASYSVQYAYDVRIVLTDTVGTTVISQFTLPSDSVSISERAHNKGVGIGTYAINDDEFVYNPNWTMKKGTDLSLGNLVYTALSSGVAEGYMKIGKSFAIAWARVVKTVDITTAWGSMYEASGHIALGNLPIAFDQMPTITITPESGWNVIIGGMKDASATSWGAVKVVRATSGSNVQITFHLFAIGKCST